MRRAAVGSVLGLAAVAACSGVLFPFRASVSIATVGLVLVVPVVMGVVFGGVGAGVVSVASGFLVYDFVFIRPYYTLSVGAAQNWVALGVYVVVMLVVARVVSRLQEARSDAQRRARAAQRLLELSEMLVTEAPPAETLQRTVDAIRAVVGAESVALLTPRDGGLELRAAAGEPPSASDLAALRSQSGVPVPIGLGHQPGTALRAVPLVSSGRPVGVLALRGIPAAGTDRDLLQTFVNQVALMIERGELHDRAVRSQILEEGDRMRRALLSAVSHDLRTPLSTIKVAATSLLDSEQSLDGASRLELYELLDGQADRLDRLVTGLLDMNRYQSGALHVRKERFALGDLIDEAVAAVGPAAGDQRIEVELPEAVPWVRADRLLMGQVVVNLLDNALRYGPPDLPVKVVVERRPNGLVVSVSDAGPGVPAEEQGAVFENFFRSGSGGRAGLGLWICQTFVEAHGQQIWIEDAHPGARFSFTIDTDRSED